LMTMHLAWALGFLIGIARASRVAQASGHAAASTDLAAKRLFGDSIAGAAAVDQS